MNSEALTDLVIEALEDVKALLAAEVAAPPGYR